MKKPFSVFLIVSCVFAQAQDIVIPKNRIPVQHPDFFAWVEVYQGEVKPSSLENNKTYFWVKAKQIHTSKGGYYGELLHGDYTALYKTDALKEQGKYDRGLKVGEWKEWHPNGELKLISHWRKGLPSGYFFYSDATGKTTRRERFKRGLLHGRQYTYTDSTETYVRYRKGKPVKQKIRRKKEKIKAQAATEIPATDTASAPVREKKIWLPVKNKKKPESEIPDKNKEEKQKESEPEDDKNKNRGRKKKTGTETPGKNDAGG